MPSLVLGTAGHIDHGKSALVEALTGTHPDRLAEEQRRGITIELGFTHTQIGGVAVSLVDVPGHERFVKTMVAGAAGVDAVLLVIAATESVMPQTREHLDICRLLGVTCGVVALSKVDLVSDVDLAAVTADVRAFLAGSFLADAPIIGTSVRTGAGIEALRDALTKVAEGVRHAASGGAARVPIDRSFTVKGFGTVATGTLTRGRLTVDDTVTVAPHGAVVRIRGLQVAGGDVSSATAPSRVAINLGGVTTADVARGTTVCAIDGLCVTTRADVVVDLLPSSAAVRHGARVQWLQGTTDVGARLSIVATAARNDDTWVPVAVGAGRAEIPPGGRALVRCRFDRPVAMALGDRFVLRQPAPVGTIGGGRVLHPAPSRRGARRDGTAARLIHLLDASEAQAVELWVVDAGIDGLSLADVGRRLGATQDDVAALLTPLTSAGALMRVDDVVLHHQAVTRHVERLQHDVQAYHQRHPTERGMPREQARGTLAPAVFGVVLERAGLLGTERLARPGFVPAGVDADAATAAHVMAALTTAGVQPPLPADVATAARVTVHDLTRVLTALSRQGRVQRVGDLWFARTVLDGVVTSVRELGAGATIDIAAMKARFGVSRKFAVPLLEFLDRERVTRRVGDRRIVL